MFQIFEHKRINFRVQVIKEKDTFAKGRNTDSISLRESAGRKWLSYRGMSESKRSSGTSLLSDLN